MSTTPDERLLDDEAWHLALMQACTGLTAGANAIGRDRAARIEEAAALRAEVERLREKNAALNRRCQSAESGLAHLDKGPGSTSLGRALANSAATMYAAKLKEAEREVERLRRLEEAIDGVLPEDGSGIYARDYLIDALYLARHGRERHPRPPR